MFLSHATCSELPRKEVRSITGRRTMRRESDEIESTRVTREGASGREGGRWGADWLYAERLQISYLQKAYHNYYSCQYHGTVVFIFITIEVRFMRPGFIRHGKFYLV